ncbi:hypothetical protein HYH03_013461 [Edaphochlamys debaryana]|uniref:carnosine N-methyltransferase n=1 Tax=Edaphochlamys debaryana TaxID=47281 RepID=A0A835XY97_9CHLO|nr:hypothetical protein HYH03_013461 [Edaphochlamys debaryana]|eukprot:KAG2487879.1 hypothetical protein HYH03_013461 [Edaphochlamys debaryana]
MEAEERRPGPTGADAAISSGLFSHDEEHSRELDEEAEQEALNRIILAFRDYPQSAEWEVARWQFNYTQLPPHHKALVPHLPAKLAAARRAAQTNAFFIKSLLQAFSPEAASGPLPPSSMLPHPENPEPGAGSGAGPAAHSHGHTHGLASCGAACGAEGQGQGQAKGAGRGPGDKEDGLQPVDSHDVEKVRYVLKNIARDWSAEGAAERAMSYGKILDELKVVFKDWSNPNRAPRVLIPGAGLARLCVEVAGLGYEAQGNEFSYFMLLASSFILNHTTEPNQYTIHPWMHSNSNHLSDEDQLRAVPVPDVLPAQLAEGTHGRVPGLLSMCAGDFVEVYSEPDQRGLFDCVVTCFFIDTAHNVLKYLEVISHCLAPGGTWINLGPLLYHWADAHTYLPGMELSIELSLDDIRTAAQAMGFRMVREEMLDAPYMADPRSMHKTVYQAVFWTMTKERDWEPPAAAAAATPVQPPPPPPPRKK